VVKSLKPRKRPTFIALKIVEEVWERKKGKQIFASGVERHLRLGMIILVFVLDLARLSMHIKKMSRQNNV